MSTYHCSYSIENALKIQKKGGVILQGGTLFISYMAIRKII